MGLENANLKECVWSDRLLEVQSGFTSGKAIWAHRLLIEGDSFTLRLYCCHQSHYIAEREKEHLHFRFNLFLRVVLQYT